MRAHRILMTTDFVGGVWRFASSMANAVVARGGAVVLVGMGPPPTAEQRAALDPAVELVVTDFGLEWMDPHGRDFERTLDGLAEIAHRIAPGVVHLNGYREALADWPAPVIVTAHSCVLSWWQAVHGARPGDASWAAYADNVARGLDAAAVWTAPTHAFCAEIERTYGPRQAGLAIHNGLDVHAPGAAKQPFIISAGRLWDEGKNIRAVAAVAGELPWPVVVAGASRSPDGVERVFDNVTCCGELSRDELLQHMARAAIYAAPALYEPFGLAVLEAASCDCALVLSDIPTLRELWDEAALFVPAGDDTTLRRALLALCNDEPRRRELQRAAAARARRYSLAHTVAAYGELYDEAAGATAKGPRVPSIPAECRA